MRRVGAGAGSRWEQLPLVEGAKLSILDGRCRDRSGTTFLVEMQLIHHPGFVNRVVYNVCKAYSGQLEGGDSYTKLSDVVAISICDVWSAGFGDASLSFCDVATDAAGDVFVGGELTGVLSLGGPALASADIHVAKFDAGGSHLWSIRVGDGAWQSVHDVATDLQNDIYLVGRFGGHRRILQREHRPRWRHRA